VAERTEHIVGKGREVARAGPVSVLTSVVPPRVEALEEAACELGGRAANEELSEQCSG
jgi:hypothetical protein